MKILNVAVGADPEMFLFHKGLGSYLPAVGLFGGTKSDPLPLGVDGFAVQEDNVMVEFNIPPARSADEFANNIATAINLIKQQPYMKESGDVLELRPVSAAEFGKLVLKSTPGAEVAGCDPDFNAYTVRVNRMPPLPATWRAAGGHVHVSWDNPEMDQRLELVKIMDLMLGVAFVLIDKGSKRKEVYGKAGAFRPKEYGVEYRVAPNVWLRNRNLTAWTYNNTIRSVDMYNDNFRITKKLEKAVINVINKDDVKGAEKFVKDFDIMRGI